MPNLILLSACLGIALIVFAFAPAAQAQDAQAPAPAEAPAQDAPREPAIIPKPTHIESKSGHFRLTAQTAIVCRPADSVELRAIAGILAQELGVGVKFDADAKADANAIVLTLDPQTQTQDEGYWLTVRDDSVSLTARKPAGVFYGVQTLRQLLDRDSRSLPNVQIADAPRFAHRGMLLDVGRHFRTVDEVKRYIDLLAYHKMNVLHWHLTEDQGWRIEIRKYPKLAEIGAWRDDGKGGRYGGFYTQDEVRDVVAYAKSRYITVVPEIEMPGHSVAALAAYPELSCTGGPHEVATKWGIFEDVYCAGNDRTFEFLEDVLTEVMQLFPGEFIHIGGDECPKARWQACPKCQARIKRENLKNEHELQSWFIRRIDKFLADNGRRLVGWDEILEGGLAPGATVQSWRGMEGAVAAATSGHDTIVSPTSHCYLDYSYDRTPVHKSYAFEPIPAQLTAEQARHVLGLEGNIWAEHTPALKDVDRQVWPRLCALSEVAWSDPTGRSFDEFAPRLEVHVERLKLMGVDHGPTTRPTTGETRQK